MITYFDVLNNPALLALTEDFCALFGGEFIGHSPDGRLFYSTEGDTDARLSPYEESVETLFPILQDSINSKQNLIMERWPVLEYEPDCVY